MRKWCRAVAALVVAVAASAVPAVTARADGARPPVQGCNRAWPGRNGNMYAWADLDCQGTLLGKTAGNDTNWADGAGPFQSSDNDRASSVMNAGTLGGRDVVAFYLNVGLDFLDGYACLSPNEMFADDLRDNYFLSVPSTRKTLNDNISSHYWVTKSDCAAGSWIT
ncbi:hypothetical protein AGRA3207_003251 [Actinomadura graeca]|uniref:Secreted protein n=1 Tax=Actinomadura graeca TaxID=2750812 RepID=A0ABX8QXU0_9ACTN|nr:hypothetical protein [Actinomadura graeca]QXJ22272.1 hypothetical protein AGRA3207_003251 [Actinomadura graeca]